MEKSPSPMSEGERLVQTLQECASVVVDPRLVKVPKPTLTGPAKPPQKRTQKQHRKWSMFSSKHTEVARLLWENELTFNFYNNDTDEGVRKAYDTNVMGWFQCRSRKCPTRGWSSKKIAVTIRLYANNRYNVRVYHQRCMECNGLSKPDLDNSYDERVAYRLKKWSGVEVEKPYYSGKKGKPHESEYCEGCAAGHCREGGDAYEIDELDLKLAMLGLD